MNGMKGKVRITHDLYGVADRLREIDDRYEVWYDRIAGRYEIYAGGALQIAVPFAELDARKTAQIIEDLAFEAEAQKGAEKNFRAFTVDKKPYYSYNTVRKCTT